MWELPPEVSEEIVRRYADVLRVGCMRVNGEFVRWRTDTATELQLQSFCERFHARLSALLPELAAAEPQVLCLVAYWFCKSVSINYALIEVLLLIKRKVGVLCTVETREPGGGGLVEYNAVVHPGGASRCGGASAPSGRRPSLTVSLKWRKGDNIVYRDPEKAEARVKGSLSSLTTEFKLPPEEWFTPAYHLQMRLRRSLAARFASRVACGGGSVEGSSDQLFTIDEPLRGGELDFRSDCQQEAEASTAQAGTSSRPPEPRPLGLQDGSRGIRMPEAEACPLLGDPFDSGLWDLGPDEKRVLTELEPPSYDFHVRVLRAICRAASGGVMDWKPKLYATCRVADIVERTRIVCPKQPPLLPSFGSPPPHSQPLPTWKAEDGAGGANLHVEWLQGWDFPVRDRDLRGDVLVEVFDSGTEKLSFLGRASIPVSRALQRERGFVVPVTEQLRGLRGSLDVELELRERPFVGLDAMVAMEGVGYRGEIPGIPALKPWADEDRTMPAITRAAAPDRPAPAAAVALDSDLGVKVRSASPGAGNPVPRGLSLLCSTRACAAD